MSNQVSKEEHFKGTEEDADEWDSTRTKTYTYDPFGSRVAMTDKPEGQSARGFNYVYDPHGSVSLLIDDAGEAKAQYGYTAYGASDPDSTHELDPDGQNGATTKPREALNPYRYTGKRMDTGSGVATGGNEGQTSTRAVGSTLDMGARHFGPEAASFLQADAYAGAVDDLNLSLNPLTQNRYGLAGGKPISFVEVDGHEPAEGSFVNNPQRDNIYGGRSGANVNYPALRRQQDRTTTDANSTGTGYGPPPGVAAKPYPRRNFQGHSCGRMPTGGPAAGSNNYCGPPPAQDIGAQYQCTTPVDNSANEGCYDYMDRPRFGGHV